MPRSRYKKSDEISITLLFSSKCITFIFLCKINLCIAFLISTSEKIAKKNDNELIGKSLALYIIRRITAAWGLLPTTPKSHDTYRATYQNTIEGKRHDCFASRPHTFLRTLQSLPNFRKRQYRHAVITKHFPRFGL